MFTPDKPTFAKGEPLAGLRPKLNQLSDAIRSSMQPGSFQSGGVAVQRQIGGPGGGGGGTVTIRQGFIVGKVDEDTEFEGWTWEKEDGKRWLKPPARDLKDPPPEDEEEDPYHPYWSVEVHLCSQDDDGNYAMQYTLDEEEDPPVMIPSTARALRVNAEKLTLPKSEKEMTHDWNTVSNSWVSKPDAEVEVYAFPCEILAGRVYIDQCNMVRVLKEPPEPPEEEP